jgi:hypothetical protein
MEIATKPLVIARAWRFDHSHSHDAKHRSPYLSGGIIREEMNMNDAAEAELDCALRIPVPFIIIT